MEKGFSNKKRGRRVQGKKSVVNENVWGINEMMFSANCASDVVDANEYFKSSDKSFVSSGSCRKYISFVDECDAECLEKYMRAIYNYANNVGAKKMDVKVVSAGCPHVYLLCASMEVPCDAPCVDCFDKYLVEFVEG